MENLTKLWILISNNKIDLYVLFSLYLIVIISRIILIILNPSRDKYSGIFVSFFPAIISILGILKINTFDMSLLSDTWLIYILKIFLLMFFFYLLWDLREEYTYYKHDKEIRKFKQKLERFWKR